jgi:hypothetical protein
MEDLLQASWGANTITTGATAQLAQSSNAAISDALWDDKCYELTPSENISSDSPVAQDLYGNIINRDKKSDIYHSIKFDKCFENKETGISIGLYSEDYCASDDHEMCYSSGLFIQRSDGTYSAWPVRKWRNSDWDVDKSKRIMWVKSIKIVDNRIIAELELWDGTQKDVDIGAFKLPPVYTIYRNNATYSWYGLQQAIRDMHGQNRIVSVYDGIFDQWTEITENDFIRSIPDNAIVITDNAALRALPWLANKKVINIEQDILPDTLTSSRLIGLWDYARKINPNPWDIKIFLPWCADHVEIPGYEYNHEGYADVLKSQLQQTFPGATITTTNNVSELNDEAADIKVIDRHQIWENWVEEDDHTLLLPLYENKLLRVEQDTKGKTKGYIESRLRKSLEKHRA